MSAEVRHSAPEAPQDALSDRFGALFSRIEYRRAVSPEEREAIFPLRHDAYLRDGAIAPNHAGHCAQGDDPADNAYLVGLHIDGELASALRLHIASKDHPDFPSLRAFPDILQRRLDAGRIILNFTRFVADERLARLHRAAFSPHATLRPCMLAAEYFHADETLAAVPVEHQTFYQRALNHQVLCAPRPYRQLARPIGLMSLDFPSEAERLYRRYPFFRSTVRERRMLFERLRSLQVRPQPVATTNAGRVTSPPWWNATPRNSWAARELDRRQAGLRLTRRAWFSKRRCDRKELAAGKTLERDGSRLNRHHALDFCWSMIFSESRQPTFPDHALAAGTEATGSD